MMRRGRQSAGSLFRRGRDASRPANDPAHLPTSPPPRLGSGWVLVWTLAFTEMVSWGILYYAFAVFLTPMQADLGWSRAELTGAYSLALLLSGFAAVPVGRWVDRRGPRLLMSLGAAGASLLVLAWSRVDSLTAFYLIWAGIGLAMAAVLYEPAFVVIAHWFARRGRPLTVLTFVGGLASVVFIPLAAWLEGSIGWRPALAVLAAILALGTILPHALLLRPHPPAPERAPDAPPETAGASLAMSPSAPARDATVRTALRGAAFWWLTTSFCLVMVAAVAVTVHLIPFLIEQGYDAGFAATAAGLVGLLALPGRLVFTPLGDRLPRSAVTAAIFLLQAVSLVVLLAAGSTTGVLLFVVLFGAGFGAITPARAALVADLYGVAHYGGINGVLALFVTVARAIAPLGASLLAGWAGGYRTVLWTLVVLSVAAAGAVLLTEPREWRPIGLQRLAGRTNR